MPVSGGRRLTAIMFTDLEGYTPLSHTDEAGALQLLEAQERLLTPVLSAFRGRKVKSIGDGLLMEFPNARDAVEAAVEFQRSIREYNKSSTHPPLRMRIGIHVGDVEARGDDILGDAVNIAARIEPLSEVGGVCLSAQAFDQVHNKVGYGSEKLGPRILKGLADPVGVYRLIPPWQASDASPPSVDPNRLAVLPFANISPDPSDEYFAEGLTEELITVLSRLPGLQVIARTSVVPYKGTSKPLSQIASELQVGSILEGSVRKAGNRLRITAQLIDVPSQAHKWANSYDRNLDDIFAVQSDVAERIASALRITVERPKHRPTEARAPVNPESYLAYLRGRTLLYAAPSSDKLVRAREQFELAAALDPTNARAFSGLADVVTWLGWTHKLGPRDAWVGESRAHAARAAELDPNLAEAHCSLAMILWDDWDFVSAEREFQLAVSLNPSYAVAHHHYGAMLLDGGRVGEALPHLALSQALDPQDVTPAFYRVFALGALERADELGPVVEHLARLAPDSGAHHVGLAWLYYTRGEFAASLQEVRRAYELNPDDYDRVPAVWLLALQGQPDDARQLLEQEISRRKDRLDRANVAVAYAFLGDFDSAYRVLFRAAEEHDLALQMVRNSPRLEPLRRDARFPELLRRMNLA